MMLALPNDPLNQRRVDEHYAAEAGVARDLDMKVVLVDHDALVNGDATEAARKVPSGEKILYRGWMVTSAEYAALNDAVEARGSTLITSPSMYRQAHELPGWYEGLREFTPESIWTVGPDIDAFVEAAAAFGSGAAVLRDYTKSLKHYWDEACFIPEVTDTGNVAKIARRFLDLRGEYLNGGLVARKWEDFQGTELRTWWLDGALIASTPHPDAPEGENWLTTPPQGLPEAISRLDLRFVTVDLTQTLSGQIRVVELGDGQVSDWPTGHPLDRLYSAFVAL